MLDPCACCNTLFSADVQADGASAYCDPCELAYLSFKLSLLVAVYRDVARKADEV